mmetsp:Transcript_78812/g.255321  ORF Transcript_78812/g.255321 Transcript_78812/m.255321 type:complete len:327 (+) Transcript_78812:253-1233(+)
MRSALPRQYQHPWKTQSLRPRHLTLRSAGRCARFAARKARADPRAAARRPQAWPATAALRRSPAAQAQQGARRAEALLGCRALLAVALARAAGGTPSARRMPVRPPQLWHSLPREGSAWRSRVRSTCEGLRRVLPQGRRPRRPCQLTSQASRCQKACRRPPLLAVRAALARGAGLRPSSLRPHWKCPPQPCLREVQLLHQASAETSPRAARWPLRSRRLPLHRFRCAPPARSAPRAHPHRLLPLPLPLPLPLLPQHLPFVPGSASLMHELPPQLPPCAGGHAHRQSQLRPPWYRHACESEGLPPRPPSLLVMSLSELEQVLHPGPR